MAWSSGEGSRAAAYYGVPPGCLKGVVAHAPGRVVWGFVAPRDRPGPGTGSWGPILSNHRHVTSGTASGATARRLVGPSLDAPRAGPALG